MKNILFLSVFISISIFGQINLTDKFERDDSHSIPQSIIYEDSAYMPLRIGNSYQFIESGYGGGIIWASLRYGSVSRDTLINEQRYYLYTLYNTNRWFRYSGSEKKFYEWLNGNEMLYMDFNLAQGDTFTHLTWPYPATVLGGNTNLFSINYPFKGFSYPTGAGYYQERFASGMGLFFTRSEFQNWTGSSNKNFSLIMAILYDSAGNTHYFSNHYKPQISVTPITIIDSSNFKLNYNVTHQYNMLYPPGNISLYFIASVQLKSYYSKEDSIILLSPINPSGGAFTTALDTMLMKNGFAFNYRIIAKDKGIIPETSYSPDSGYYQCIWDGSTGIDDKTLNQLTFSLHQNYPNPFNPNTNISWQSPVGGHQTLKVFDVLGREVATLVDEYKDAGYHEVEFQLAVGNRQYASGIYYYQLKADSYVQTKKMMVIR